MRRHDGIADRAAVTGVGMTALTRSSGRSALSLAAEAARAALADAGLEPTDVDAILTYHLGEADQAPATGLARELALPRLGWHNDVHGGGTQCASLLGDAAMLIATGQAATVLVSRALNGRSGHRMNRQGLRLGTGIEAQFTLPYGVLGPVEHFALVARAYLHTAGLDTDDLAAVVAASRDHAAANPRALRRAPLPPADHRAAPMVADPLRRADCCQETDGACALVLTAADRSDAAGAPRVRAVVRGGRPDLSRLDRSPDPAAVFSSDLAPRLYAAAGMGPRDVDVALLYDAYSFLVPRQLTDFRLVAPAGLADALRTGAIGATGRIPVNPHGGLLSEGYVHGLNNVAEAVRQLRGDGVNQVPGAEVALCTGFGGAYGSAALLVADSGRRPSGSRATGIPSSRSPAGARVVKNQSRNRSWPRTGVAGASACSPTRWNR
ncbi:acetyl-CoA acetyltransferase [Nocardiopsis mwathae]|uniref:Acetyl-CoA acetyltransferase n=1 Tax=Nocardiopsis mwathae TaxID=1472723 RepID=A0A7X0D6P0_9ACTN|nr:acetyl-CoA acetyltransferase [Nocardiopsis mwathae]MBB6172926.1 acetyl-CoA acetyltransferase [Nocardiopsis mwathae]